MSLSSASLVLSGFGAKPRINFEWNPEKAKLNPAKHKVSFEEALTVFKNPLSDTFDDPDRSVKEFRFVTIGHSESGGLLFVSHTGNGKIVRIISAGEVTSAKRFK